MLNCWGQCRWVIGELAELQLSCQSRLWGDQAIQPPRALSASTPPIFTTPSYSDVFMMWISWPWPSFSGNVIRPNPASNRRNHFSALLGQAPRAEIGGTSETQKWWKSPTSELAPRVKGYGCCTHSLTTFPLVVNWWPNTIHIFLGCLNKPVCHYLACIPADKSLCGTIMTLLILCLVVINYYLSIPLA